MFPSRSATRPDGYEPGIHEAQPLERALAFAKGRVDCTGDQQRLAAGQYVAIVVEFGRGDVKLNCAKLIFQFEEGVLACSVLDYALLERISTRRRKSVTDKKGPPSFRAAVLISTAPSPTPLTAARASERPFPICTMMPARLIAEGRHA